MGLDHRVEALAGDGRNAAEDERHEQHEGAGRPEGAEGDDDRQRPSAPTVSRSSPNLRRSSGATALPAKVPMP